MRVLAALAVLSAVAAGCGQRTERVEWPVMGTVAAVQTRFSPMGPHVCDTDAVRATFTEIERLLSAHEPSSELNRLAPLSEDEILAQCDAGVGERRWPWLQVRPCYAAAFALAEASGGAFNPRWRGTNTLDLGAIAKGFAVDMAARSCYADHCDALLDLGGNLKALRGEHGSRKPWRTGVKNPDGDGFAAVVDLREGEALATSATYYRGGHIYDGRTGTVVSNGVASVTVLCESAMWADGLSTTLFILGPEEGRVFLGRNLARFPVGSPLAALWILSDGRQIKFDDDNRFYGCP